jgi:tetratricopeptide (TPR) repeat protein
MRVASASMVVGLVLIAAPAWAQNLERERANTPYRLGLEYMRAEAWPEAAKAFQDAIDIDGEFELAYYGLGRANMAMKKFVEAAAAYTRCRDLYRAQAGRQFTNRQEAQRYRQDRLTEIDELIRQLQSGPQTFQVQEMIRQARERRRQTEENLERGKNFTIENSVPAWVSLALGSAYFRSGKLADAEREYKAAIDADTKAGEAHNNLAVVYLETGRYVEAEKHVKLAERAGYRVHPQLKEDIRTRKGT